MRLKPGREGIDCTRTRIQQHALGLAISAALATGISAVVQAQDFPAVTQLSVLDGSSGFKLDGEREGDLSGAPVSDIGDVNGDGIDDVIIAAYSADPNGAQSGRSYVVFGSNHGFDPNLQLSALDGSNGFVLDGENARDFSGGSVSAAGDVNGDGIDDLIIAARSADFNGGRSGRSYVVFGRTQGFDATLQLSALDGSNGFKLDGEAAYDSAGRSVSAAGDVNGDGIDDLIIGAPSADPNGGNSGRSYVVFGRTASFDGIVQLSALDGSNGFKLDGEATYDTAGRSVSAAGDVNGDEIDDLLIGAPNADPNGERSGRSYVVFGRIEGFDAAIQLSALDGDNGFKLDGEAAYDRAGYSVSDAGDVNGDGIDDLLIGNYDLDFVAASSGRSYVVFGDPEGFDATLQLSALDGVDGFKLDGTTGDYSGRSVSTAGDINGDGIDDLVIGAAYADANGISSGRGYVVFGKTGAPVSPLPLVFVDGTDGFRLAGETIGDRAGSSVSAAGDVNGDGVDDLIIGARRADPNGTNSGRSYVVYGRVTGTPVLDFDGMKLIDFGSEFVGTTGPVRTLSLSNPGTGLVAIDSIDIGDTAFEIIGGDCGALPIRISVGGSCTLQLRFTPDRAGPLSAEMRFAGTSVTSPDSVVLAGNGLAVPVVTIMPDPLEFGDVALTSQVIETLIVENTGDGVLEPESVTIEGANTGDFSVEINDCAGNQLPGGAFCGIDIGFSPGAPGVREATLRLESSAPSSPHLVLLRGSNDVLFFDSFEAQ